MWWKVWLFIQIFAFYNCFLIFRHSRVFFFFGAQQMSQCLVLEEGVSVAVSKSLIDNYAQKRIWCEGSYIVDNLWKCILRDSWVGELGKWTHHYHLCAFLRFYFLKYCCTIIKLIRRRHLPATWMVVLVQLGIYCWISLLARSIK